MKRSAQERLVRLEKRLPEDKFASMTDEQLQQHMDDALAKLVEEFGIEEVRAKIARECTPQQLRDLDALKALGYFPEL